MAPTDCDTLIIGQGLAGTTLAWQLAARSDRVVIVDAGDAVSASTVSAGLVTPITGRRLSGPWFTPDEFTRAEAFYRDIERRVGRPLFKRHAAARVFMSADDGALWECRRTNDGVASCLVPHGAGPLLPADIADTRHGGFLMQGARLDMAAYVAASRAHFDIRRGRVDVDRDVHIDADRVSVRGLTARRVIACDGFAAGSSTVFAGLPFQPSKGEILTIRLPVALHDRAIHADVWLAPTADPHVFRAGSTSDWDTLDTVPTDAGRADIERRLRRLLRVPFETIGHDAAVRPGLRGRPAAVGLHPATPRIGLFNGLGTKGTLRAPIYAARFVAHLFDGAPLPPDIDIARRLAV